VVDAVDGHVVHAEVPWLAAVVVFILAFLLAIWTGNGCAQSQSALEND
jgi:hypothetical protein